MPLGSVIGLPVVHELGFPGLDPIGVRSTEKTTELIKSTVVGNFSFMRAQVPLSESTGFVTGF